MLLIPAPLSDELTKLATLPSELLTDSKLDIAEEQDSLSPLMLRMNLLGGF